jgi:hypothetical protein
VGDGFTAGCELNQAFYAEGIRLPLGGRPHAAALLGPGSDVLGLDTEVSTDHGWGPRLHVFVDDANVAAVRPTSTRACRIASAAGRCNSAGTASRTSATARSPFA